MKVRKIKKALKRSTTTRIITLRDINPNRFWDTLLPISYNPEIDVLKFRKIGILMVDYLDNTPIIAFPYNIITSIN